MASLKGPSHSSQDSKWTSESVSPSPSSFLCPPPVKGEVQLEFKFQNRHFSRIFPGGMSWNNPRLQGHWNLTAGLHGGKRDKCCLYLKFVESVLSAVSDGECISAQDMSHERGPLPGHLPGHLPHPASVLFLHRSHGYREEDVGRGREKKQNGDSIEELRLWDWFNPK